MLPTSDRVTFPNGRGQTLVGLLCGAPQSGAAIICHGMLSDKDSPKHAALAEALLQKGVASLRFDFAGRGESEGSLLELCYSHEIEDLEAAVAHLEARGFERLVLFGSSMGGAVALLFAARQPGRVMAVATMAAVGRLDRVAHRHPDAVRAWRQQGFVDTEAGRLGRRYLDDLAGHDVLAAVAGLRIPLLLLHGDHDEVVPASDCEELAAVASNPRVQIIAGADHRFSDPVQQRAALDSVAGFLAGEISGTNKD